MPQCVRSRPTVLAALILGGAAVLAGPALAAAQDPSGLSVVGDGATPLKLQLKTAGGIRSVDFDVFVRNDSSFGGDLRVQFLDSRSPDPVDLVATASYAPGKPVLSSSGPLPVKIAAFDVAHVRLTLGTLADDKATPVTGAIIVRAVPPSSAGVAIQRVEATDSAAASPGSASDALIAPSSTVVEITGMWPSFFWPDHPDWVFPGEPRIEITNAAELAAATKTGTQIVKTLVGGDHGGTGTIVLQRTDDASSSKITAGIQVVGLSRAGEYKDTISLDPTDDKASSLDLTVKAQDLFVWPLLVLILGVLVSRRLLVWSDDGRPRERLRAALKEAEHDFATFMGAPDGPKCPFKWDSLFPPAEHPIGSVSDGTSRAEKAYEAVNSVTTQEDLDAAATEVQSIRKLTALIPELCKAHGELTEAVSSFPPNRSFRTPPNEWPPEPPIKTTSVKLLDERVTDPTADLVQDLIKRLRDQATALKVWAEAWKTYGEALSAYNAALQLELPPDVAQQLYQANPLVIAKVELWPAVSLQELIDRRIDARLRKSWALAETIIRAYPSPALYSGSALLLVERTVTVFGQEMRFNLPDFVSATPARASDVRTPEQIRASMRRHDWLEFIASAAITSVVYLLTIYVGKNFGESGWDYVTAFTAGLAGSAVGNWALLPWYRKYSASGDLATSTEPAQLTTPS